MFRVSIRKVFRDLLLEKRRTFTVWFAIILGVFSVAMLSTSRNLLNKNLKENYLRTNPASFTLVLDSLSSAVRTELEALPELEDIEIRNSLMCRLGDENGYIPLRLFLVEDFDNLRIATFRRDQGSFPVDFQDIVIERTGNKLMDLQIGGAYQVVIPGYQTLTMNLTGLVHDPGMAPSWMEGMFFGYVKRELFDAKFLAGLKPMVKFTVATDKYNEAHIKNVVVQIRNRLQQKGYPIIRSEVLTPGVHIHEKQMNALMFLIQIFGVLTLFLSCFLIINMISAIMTREIRQIGVMKAIGAGTLQITLIYLIVIIILSVTATAFATPLGMTTGKAFAELNAQMLNFELFYQEVDHLVILFIIATGILLPVIISFIPVWNSGRISVNKSLNDFGVSTESVPGTDLISRFTSYVDFSSAFSLAIRNSFRRKGRLALTLVTLILGGAIFITTFNIRESTNLTVSNNFDTQPQNLMYILHRQQPVARLQSILNRIDGILAVEYGNTGITTLVEENGLDSKPIDLKAVDPLSSLYIPEMMEGKWISGSPEGIVINQVALTEHPSMQLGRQVKLKINGVVNDYPIVGICRQLFTPARIYVDNHNYNQTTASQDQAKLLLIDVADEDPETIATQSSAIESEFKKEKIDITLSISKAEYKFRVVQHLAIIIMMLVSMTFLVIVVGGLGIITTMGINIIERNREIGILRAIGITNRSLFKIIVYEGGMIGLISWLFSILVSIPVSIYLGNGFFGIFFESTMTFRLSVLGLVIWLLINIVFCAIAAYFPAKRAAGLSVKQALAYE